MAFPVIAAGNTSTNASGTSHTVNLPTGIVAGNLLVVVFGGSAAATLTWPAGWTEFLTGGATGAVLNAAYKLASGSEGSTITVTSGATSLTSNTRSYRITGSGEAPQAGVNVTISSSATGDPPSLTPTWAASLDILWIAISFASTQSTVSTYPTSYTNTAVLANGSTGLATCNLNATGTVQDPAAFTWGGTGRKNTNTIAIKPGFPFVATLASAGLTGFGPGVSGSESATTGSLGLTGFAPGINGPKGAFSHTAVNAAFWPSRRYGSFSGRGAAVDNPETPSRGSLTFTGIASTISIAQPKGTFGPIDVNAGFWPSRRYGSFASKGGTGSVSITPARASVGFTGIASPLSQGMIIAPAMGSILMTGFAPVDIIANIVAPSVGSAGFTGISSTLRVENIIRGPPVAALAMTGTIPTVLQAFLISPLQGSLSATGLAPSQGQNYFITPSKGDLSAGGGVSIILVGGGSVISAGGLALIGAASIVRVDLFIQPAAGSLSASGIAAGVSGSESPSSGSVTITGIAPSAVQGVAISATAGSAAFSGAASTLKVEVFITPPAGVLSASGIAAGSSRSVTPSTGVLSSSSVPSVDILASIAYPAAGSGSFTLTTPALLLGSVGLPPQGSLGASGFGPLIQLVTLVPSGSLSFTGNNASVTSTGIQLQKTQLGPRFIPQKRYKLDAFANKFGTQQPLIPAASLTLSGYAPSTITGAIPTAGTATLIGLAPTVSISATGDRFVTPPAGSLSAIAQAPNSIRGSTKKTQLSSQFIPGRRYGRFDSKAGININVAPTCGGGIRINYLVDGLGNYIVDENGNYILSYNDQPGTTAIFNSFLPVVQVSVLAGINISPSRGSLSVTSQAPSIQLERFITPSKGDINAIGNAPTASIAMVIAPPAGALGISSAAPNAGISYFLTPPRGSLQATGLLSTVVIGSGVVGAIIIVPSNGVIAAIGNQSVTKTAAITPQGQLSIGGFAPVVSRATVIVPSRAQVFALGQFPVPARSTVISPSAGSLTATSAAALQAIQSTIPAAQLGLTGYAPFVTTETGLRVTSGNIAATGFPPAQATTWSAATGQASFTGYPPQIPKVFIPAAGQIGSTGFVSLFKQPEVILIELTGAAVGTLTLQGKLIGDAELSGNAILTVVISR
jgi:hypothetical protein